MVTGKLFLSLEEDLLYICVDVNAALKKNIIDTNLRRGLSKSCGCYQKSLLTKHGMNTSKGATPEYVAWNCMKQRCDNPNNPGYKNYGGRGITYYKSWADFQCFFKDVGKRPSKDYLLERINNNDNYTPQNVKWATRWEQNNNKRTNSFITYQGKTQTVVQWAVEIGINKDTLKHRIKTLKWPVEKALTQPLDYTRCKVKPL